MFERLVVLQRGQSLAFFSHSRKQCKWYQCPQEICMLGGVPKQIVQTFSVWFSLLIVCIVDWRFSSLKVHLILFRIDSSLYLWILIIFLDGSLWRHQQSKQMVHARPRIDMPTMTPITNLESFSVLWTWVEQDINDIALKSGQIEF